MPASSTAGPTVVTTPPTPKLDGKSNPTVVKATVVKQKRKRNPYVIVGFFLVVAAAIWYFFFQPAPKSQVTVRYAAVETGNITKAITATGTVQAVTTVQVGSQVSGTIKELYADFNSHVKKGQLLAILDPTFYQAAVTEAQANLSRGEADLNNAERDYKRGEELLAKQLIAPAEFDVTKTKYLDAKAAVQQVQAQLDRAKVNLGYTIINSPISGVVVSRNVDRGQTVAASLNAPVLFVIAEDLSSMQVSASVDEADIGQVQTGQDVKFTVDAYPGNQFGGTVAQVRINPVTAQNVVTYAVIINTPNPDDKLLPGMTATVSIVSDSKEDVTRVPTAAVRFVPAPEFLQAVGLPADTGKSTTRARTATKDSATVHARNNAGAGSYPRTIYVKAKNDGPKQAVQKVKIVAGLSDGSYTEILSSVPPLIPGDSVVVGAMVAADAAAKPGASSSPLTPQRPGGGGGGRRGP